MAKGQLLERPVIVPFERGCLDGIYLRGSEAPPLLVGSPHPRLGGSMQNPVVNELAYAAARHGRASLRFDYEGIGASEGVASEDPEQAASNMKHALEHLLETASQPSAAIAGYSFGCLVALLLASREPRIDRLLLVAPPRKMLSVPDYGSVSIPVTVVVGEADTFADVARERELAQAHAPRVRLEILPEVDHSFRNGNIQLARITERFLGARRAE